jgi:ABC-type nickel/cobalt efflux system permease component RcnA
VPVAVAVVLLLPASPVSAHPLGNFTINQYVGLTLHGDRVEAEAVVDAAEIPTLQDRPSVDADSDGVVTDTERAGYAGRACSEMAAAVSVRVDGRSLTWTVVRSSLGYSPGTGGLEVSRLECAFTAPADLSSGGELRVDNTYLGGRVGWRELTATGRGVRLVDPPVPADSVSKALRDYPRDPLSSTLDVRSATVRLAPGTGTDATVAKMPASGDPVSRWMATVDRRFADLVGGPNLTPLVGLLAVALALLLGAGHALLPGHGKTVLAAYLAGRRGRPRDALTVAGTVTLAHTGVVLAVGLLITAGTALAGEQVLAWLGLVSGALVLVVGASMLVSHIRQRRRHHHAHAHIHHTDIHGPEQHDHDDDHHGRSGRWGLAGIGLAGGLVPSPSALVVLLAAIGLGRTAFGVLLVVAYGLGMAATLTGAGLLLLALQRRLARRATVARPAFRASRVVARVHAATPAATAALVLVVGAGLAARAAAAVL